MFILGQRTLWPEVTGEKSAKRAQKSEGGIKRRGINTSGKVSTTLLGVGEKIPNFKGKRIKDENSGGKKV